MKRVLIHAKKGYVVVASVQEGNVVVTEVSPKFKVGEDNSTIPNTMHALSAVLKKLAAGEELAEVAVIGSVADKVNSDILVKEFRNKRVLSNRRVLTEPELEVYKNLIANVAASYGQVLVQSEQFVSKSLKAGQTADQIEWVNLYATAKATIDAYTMPSPEMADGAVDPEDKEIAI